jgi:Tol biopolymer transport system component
MPRPFLSTSRREYSPSWSASGDRLAYITNRSGSDEIWLRSAGGDWERPVVTKGDFPDEGDLILVNAVLSPDGKRLAFNRYSVQSGIKLWISPSSGGKPVQAIPPHPGVRYFENGLSWAPDSGSFACNIYVDGLSRLAIISVGSGKAPEFVSTPVRMGTAPSWSADGRWIAYGNSQEECIILIAPDGKDTRRYSSPVPPESQGFVLTWSRDNLSLYIASSLGTGRTEGRLDALDITTGESRKIGDFGPDINFCSYFNFCLFGSLSPDGKSLVTTCRVPTSDLWILDGALLPGPRK